MAKFFHPSDIIRRLYPNTYKTLRLENVSIIRDGMVVVSRREQRCYFVNIDGIDDVLHIVAKHFKVERPPLVVFNAELRETEVPAVVPPDSMDENRISQQNVVQNVPSRQASSEDIAELRRRGIEVDDDNEPAPENAWGPPAQGTTGQWIVPTICPRRADSKISNVEGKWKQYTWEEIANMGELDLFRMAFPEKFIVDVILPASNKNIIQPISLQEFYVWLGCQFFMACFEGIANREDWWSTKPILPREGAPFRLYDYMQKSRFLKISAAITYTTKPPPLFVDKFHDVRQMLDSFNQHYEDNYIPSWMNCLDESMSSWLNQYCPGFMYVPRKPHPSGNEYHSIADGDQGKPIMWRVKLQEGKDRPMDSNNKPRFPTEFENNSKTSALMLYMTKPIHNTGKVVTMDSGFCVAAGILALHHVGVYGQALIKKRGRFWPKHVPGQMIEEALKDKDLGHATTFKQSIDGKDFFVHCQKDDCYITKIMSTHGLVMEVEDHLTYRNINGEWTSFKYAEPMSRHNRSKHWVDDVNNRRHDPIGLEDVWATKWWPTRQFTFICSVAEVNAVNSRARARKGKTDPQLTFRRNLALDMLENKIGLTKEPINSPIKTRRQRKVPGHCKKTRPTFSGKWDSVKGKWKHVRTEYMRLDCAVCKKSTRTYCVCNPSVSLCERCYYDHETDHNHSN